MKTTPMLVICLTVATVGQQRGARPLRIGALARQLTDAQVASLSRLVTTSDRRPWLLIGTEAFAPAPRSWHVDIYLTADTATPQIRRGRIITAVSTGADPDPDRLQWERQGAGRWAQVALPGRLLGDQVEERDSERPFRVVGDFVDDEIVSLIGFLRASPRRSPKERIEDPTSSVLATTVQGSWPVSRLSRTAGEGVEVDLLHGENDGQLVVLKRTGQDWVITDLRLWVSG